MYVPIGATGYKGSDPVYTVYNPNFCRHEGIENTLIYELLYVNETCTYL